MKKRWMALTCLVLMVISPAVHAQGPWQSALRAGDVLLTDVSNVTLSLRAELFFGGERFKTVDAKLTLDGEDRLEEIRYASLLPGGDWQETGAVSHLKDGRLCVISDLRDPVYDESTASGGAKTVLALSEAQQRHRVTAYQLAGLMDSLMSDGCVTEDTPDGKQITLRFGLGASVGLLDSLTLSVVRAAAKRWLSFDETPQAVGENDVYTPYDYTDLLVEYWDWDEAYAQKYEELYGEKPLLDEAETAAARRRRAVVQSGLYENAAEKASAWTSGIVRILKNGDIRHYVTYDEYLLAMDRAYIIYENEGETMRLYYRMTRQQELPSEVLAVSAVTDNRELLLRLSALKEEMDGYFGSLLTRQGALPYGAVFLNGRMVHYDSVSLARHAFESRTRQILWAMSEVRWETAGITCRTDREDRLTALEGEFTWQVVNHMGLSSPLTVSFSLTAEDYGQTAVPSFDPAAWGAAAREEYERKLPAKTPAPEAGLPDEVEWEGTVYRVRMNAPEGAE